MRYKIEAPGFEGQLLEIDAGPFKKTLLLNGAKAPAAGKMGQYRLTRNDGREVTTKWAGAFDPAPSIVIDGQTIRTAPPLAWYEVIVVGAPVLLVFAGGAIGGLLGAVAATFNANLMRSRQPAVLRYLGCFAITAAAAITYVLLAGALHLAVNG